MEEIIEKLQSVFRDVLDNDEIILSSSSSAEEIEEWDSLSHIQLIVAVEKAFKIRFNSKEILSWKNVGEMVQSIQNHLG